MNDSDNTTSDNKLLLVNLDLSEISEGSLIYMIGKKKSGKRTLIRDIIETRDWKEKTIVFSPDEKIENIYSKYISSSQIHDELTEGDIEKICQIQDHRIVVLDGVLHLASDSLYEIIERLVVRPNLTVILTTQFPSYFPPELIQSFSYIFAFHQDSSRRLKRLYQNYFDNLLTYESFCEVMDTATKNYGSVVIGKDNKIYQFCARLYPDTKADASGLTSYCNIM